MYKFLVNIIAIFFYLLNGKPKVTGLDHLPKDESVILAATHRSALDPFYLVMILRNRTIAFMAKESLFQNKILASLLKAGHVFPIDRDKPSTKVIKHAVNELTKGGKDLGIFPSGSRYSTEIKGGTAFIQGLSKKAIIPISIQPPKNFWEFISRKKAKVAFGPAIAYDSSQKYRKGLLEKIDQKIASEFDRLDNVNDPDYVYIIPKKKK